MTNHVVRLYTAAAAIVTFFLLWATIAAHPWATTEQVTPQDPRLVALALREKSLRKRAVVVNRVVARRWAIYERRSARRQWQNATALQRHVQELEASQAAAVRTAQRAVAESTRARAYAASVVAWANQQLQASGGSATTATSAAVTSAKSPSTTGASGSTTGRPAGAAPTGAAAAKAPVPAPAAPSPSASAPAPPAAPAPATAPPPAAAPPAAATPAAAPAPVQVVSLPPVTTTKPSKK